MTADFHLPTVEALRDQIRGLEQDNQRLGDERNELSDLVDKISLQLTKTAKERESLARRCSVRFEQTQAVKADLAAAQARIAELERELNEACTELLRVGREHVEMSDALDDAKREAAEARHAVALEQTRRSLLAAHDGWRDCPRCNQEIQPTPTLDQDRSPA